MDFHHQRREAIKEIQKTSGLSPNVRKNLTKRATEAGSSADVANVLVVLDNYIRKSLPNVALMYDGAD